ncbi:transposase [Streptosporangium saharense]|uniref:Transposase n=1 Tax=Streptosporangium saharense TaxID=1706840 RepID=A0A7W7QSS9_9ACTN|nr:transposase [Streptosporangium saharense]
MLHGTRYSPHHNPVEQVWAALKAFIANAYARRYSLYGLFF